MHSDTGKENPKQSISSMRYFQNEKVQDDLDYGEKQAVQFSARLKSDKRLRK